MKNIIKSNKGITLVSLIVTVIVLIILTGISINMTLGENGILTMAKRAKENMESAQLEEQERLNELYKDLNYEDGETGGEISYDIIAKLNEFKKKIADYIEEAGGIKPEYTDSTETFGERIKGIVANVTKETNAEEPQILTGYKAYSKGKLRIGSMPNQGAKTASLNAGASYTIPVGYHNGQGKITANSLASQTPADATAEDILEGKTAWVNGNKITGTAINNSDIEFTQVYYGRLGTDNGTLIYSVEVNISSLIENYKDLTANNFLFEVEGVRGNGINGTNAGAEMSKSYDSNKGIIKISVNRVYAASIAYVYGSLICIH